MKGKLILTGAAALAISTSAFAEGENIVSSKAYVDSGVAQKQRIISKVANANTAMLFPTTTGERPQERVISTEVGNDTNLVTRGGVNTALNTKQETVNGVTGAANKVVLYNSNGGLSGSGNPAKGIYSSTGTYSGQTANLVEAGHVNAAVKNGFNAHLTCANPNDGCTLYNVNTLSSTYVPQNETGN